jgi:hypothetical protein
VTVEAATEVEETYGQEEYMRSQSEGPPALGQPQYHPLRVHS